MNFKSYTIIPVLFTRAFSFKGILNQKDKNSTILKIQKNKNTRIKKLEKSTINLEIRKVENTQIQIYKVCRKIGTFNPYKKVTGYVCVCMYRRIY